MKAISFVLGLVLFSYVANATVCEVVGGTSVLFQKATAQTDNEYTNLEGVSVQGLMFELKAGHGVARLEARVSGKLIGSTFYSYGRSPAETDSLRLEIRAPNGQLVEAQCYNVDTIVP